MPRRSCGFTLIEVAMVLVIVGLLVGSVVTGQQLIRNAKVRNLITQQDGAKTAFFGFEDRYRALPGDYRQASTNINCGALPCLNGDGNGRIDAPNSANLHEEILAWMHLSAAGFLNGNYAMSSAATSTPSPNNTPQNPFGAYMQVAFDGLWGKDSNRGTPVPRHSVKTGNQVPVEIAAEIDRKVDDGRPYGGAFQFSTFSGSGSAPDVGGTAGACTSSDADDGIWNEPAGQSNCGAASLL
jgi:prepilin-type N-terminal cleavage/methylation domain-containing protein